MTDWLLDGIFGWLADRLTAALGWLLDFLTSTFFTSPDVTVFPQVQTMATRSALVVDACFVLAVIAAGAIGMTHGGFQIRYAVKDLIPRLVVGLIASAFATQVCAGVIQVANAITTVMVGQAASGPRVVRFVADRLAHGTWDPTVRPLMVVIGLLIVVLLFQLLFSWFARVATLLVLAGTAPIALGCYGLPHTQPVADLWWRALLGVLATPLLQGVAFSTGVDLLLDPSGNFAIAAGLPVGSDALNLFLIACLLVVTVRIPRLVARYLAQGGRGMSTAGVLLRAVVIQTVTRHVPIPGLRRAWH
jgi:hypothetical protein